MDATRSDQDRGELAPIEAARPRLLLHLCCGPCATSVIEQLVGEFQLTCYWYNPNIEPQAEHDRRLAAARQVTAALGVELVVPEQPGYEDARTWWLATVAGLEQEPEGGRRCTVCFEMRLREAAAFAAEAGFPQLACTLTISPHKDAAQINDLGHYVAAEYGLTFLERDFKQADGFQRSVEISRELGLYRQNYCGCHYGPKSVRGVRNGI